MRARKSGYLQGAAGLLASGLVLASVGSASPGFAHDQVLDQSPQAGEHLDTAPHRIELRFDNEPLTLGGAVMVVDAAGQSLENGDPEFSGNLVTQDFNKSLPDGNYQVRWRVVSSDGHPISESFLFSIGDVSGAPEVPAPQGGQPGTEPTESDVAVRSNGTPIPRSVILGGIGAAGALACFFVFHLVSRRVNSSSKGNHQ